MPPPYDLPPDAAAALAAYVPDLASPEHAPLIRALAAEYCPAGRPDAVKGRDGAVRARPLGERTGRPVDPDALLVPDVIYCYASEALTSLAPSTRETQRGLLLRVVRGRAGQLDGPRTTKGPRAEAAPYSPAEVDATDVTVVRGTDVAADPTTGAVLVTVRRDGHSGRTVPVLTRYEQEALALARAAGDRWIFNPAVDPARHTSGGMVALQIKNAQPPSYAPPLFQARSRATWVCDYLAAGTRIDIIAAYGGFNNPIAPALLVKHVDQVPATKRAAGSARPPVRSAPASNVVLGQSAKTKMS